MKKIISLLILLLLVIVNCVYQKSFDIYQSQNLPTSFYNTNLLLGSKTLYPKTAQEDKKIIPQKPNSKEVKIDVNISKTEIKVKDFNISTSKKIIKISTKQKNTTVSKELIKEVTKKVADINKTAITPVTLSVKEVISNINHSAIKDRELLLLEIEKAIKKAIQDRLDSIKDIENRNKGN